MVDQYQSFLIRYWRRADGTQRLSIEHITTGQRTLVPNLAAALAWLEACCAAPTPGPGTEGQRHATSSRGDADTKGGTHEHQPLANRSHRPANP